MNWNISYQYYCCKIYRLNYFILQFKLFQQNLSIHGSSCIETSSINIIAAKILSSDLPYPLFIENIIKCIIILFINCIDPFICHLHHSLMLNIKIHKSSPKNNPKIVVGSSSIINGTTYFVTPEQYDDCYFTTLLASRK